MRPSRHWESSFMPSRASQPVRTPLPIAIRVPQDSAGKLGLSALERPGSDVLLAPMRRISVRAAALTLGLGLLPVGALRADPVAPFVDPPFSTACGAIHHFGEGVAPPVDGCAFDPLCVEYEKRDITATNGGAIDFLAAEPARFAIVDPQVPLLAARPLAGAAEPRRPDHRRLGRRLLVQQAQLDRPGRAHEIHDRPSAGRPGA